MTEVLRVLHFSAFILSELAVKGFFGLSEHGQLTFCTLFEFGGEMAEREISLVLFLFEVEVLSHMTYHLKKF